MESSAMRRVRAGRALLGALAVLWCGAAGPARAQETAKRAEARTRLQAVLKSLSAPGADLSKAETEMTAVAAIDPAYGAPWYNLAILQEELKKLPAAAASLEKCLQAEPAGGTAAEARLRLALVRAAAKGSGVSPEERRIGLVTALRDAGHVGEAVVAAESAVAAFPGSWRLNALCGELLASSEMFDKAAAAFKASALTAPAPVKPRLAQRAKQAEFFVYARQQEAAATKAGEEKAPDALDRLYGAWQLNPRSAGLALMTAGAAMAKGDTLIAMEVANELARTGPPGIRPEAVKMISAVRELEKLSEQLKSGPKAKQKIDGLPEFEELREEGEEDEGDEPVARELPKQTREEALTEARGALEVSQAREKRLAAMEARWAKVAQEIAARGGDPSFAASRVAAYKSLSAAEKRRQAYFRLLVAYHAAPAAAR